MADETYDDKDSRDLSQLALATAAALLTNIVTLRWVNPSLLMCTNSTRLLQL